MDAVIRVSETLKHIRVCALPAFAIVDPKAHSYFSFYFSFHLGTHDVRKQD